MSFFTQLEAAFATRLEIVRKIWRLFKLEAKLAQINILPLIITFIMLVLSIIVIWLSGVMLLGYWIIASGGSLLLGISCVLLLNSIIIFYLLKSISTNIKQMSFSKTRAQLATFKNSQGLSKETTEFNSYN